MNTSSKITVLATAAALGIALAGCGGSGGGNNPVANTNYGYIRFVNGSADSGSVDFYIDGTKQTTQAYGGVSNYIQVKTGSHTIAYDVTGTTTAVAGIPANALTQSINGSAYTDLVLVGEQHPTNAADTINVLSFVNTPYSTPSGGFALNYHNAAPATGAVGTMFGITSSTGTQQLGATMNVAGATQPVGVPSTFISATQTVTFTAALATSPNNTITLTPADVAAQQCASNTLPCDSGNLSVYFIDGPGASSAPSAGPYPTGVSASQTAALVGLFDANGQ